MNALLKEISDKLDNAEHRYYLAKKMTKFGIWDWDIENDILIWDEEMMEMYKPKEVTNNVKMFYDSLHPEDAELVKEKLEKALHGDLYNYDFRIVTKDGEVKNIRGCGDTIRDESGKIVRMLGICLEN